jgi:hypothetical protein
VRNEACCYWACGDLSQPLREPTQRWSRRAAEGQAGYCAEERAVRVGRKDLTARVAEVCWVAGWYDRTV